MFLSRAYGFARTLFFVFIILFSLSLLVDYLVVFFYYPGILDVDARILIVDVDGLLVGRVSNTSSVVVVHGMGVNDFRVLGGSRAKVIVFVAHGLELVGGELLVGGLGPGDYALETSENNSVWTPILHPLMVLTNSIVRGEIPGLPGERVAVTRNIFFFSKPFRDKVIVLITCGSPKVRLFAKSFLDSGARLVLYLEKYIGVDEVYEIIDKVYRLGDSNDVVELLRSYGFNTMSS